MTDQATIETTGEAEVQGVQPVSEEDLLNSVVESLDADTVVSAEEPQEEDQPAKEVEEELPDEAAEKEEPERHKVKVDGEELEVEYNELVRGYQTNRHNTQTAQQLAEERRQLAPIIGLAKRLQEDKEFQQHVFSFGKEERELDPVEQIKREAKEETLAEVNKRFEAQKTAEHQAKLDAVREQAMQDSDYERVLELMADHIRSFPKHLQEQEYMALDQNPDYYLKVFNEKKESLKPKKKEPEKIKPPVLVAPGQTEEVPLQSLKQKKLDKKKAKILATGDLDALADWISADGGLVDSLGL